MDLPKMHMIISKRKIQLETWGRNFCRPLRQDDTETSCKGILKPLSHGPKNIANIWICSCQLISHTQIQEKSVEDVNNQYSRFPGTEAWTNEENDSFPSPTLSPWSSKPKTKSAHSETFAIPTTSNWRKGTSGTSMEAMMMEQLVTIFFLLLNLVDATRIARIRTSTHEHERREKAPQPCTNSCRAANHLQLETHWHLELEPWTPSWKAPRNRTSFFFAGRWHTVGLQEPVQYLHHEITCRGSSIWPNSTGARFFFRKRIFQPDTRSIRNQAGQWRPRTPGNGNPRFSMMSLHCQNTFAKEKKKRSIASNIFSRSPYFHVARKYGGCCSNWRRKAGPQQQLDSTIEETVKNAKMPVPPGPSTCRPVWCLWLRETTQILIKAAHT